MWIIDDKNNKIHETAIICDNVTLGSNNIIYPYCVIGMLGFIRGKDEGTGEIIIGDNNKLGNHVIIMSSFEGKTIIGNDNLIMNYVNIGHDVIIGSNNEVGPRSILAGWSSIGDNNKLKIAVNVRNRVKIGNTNIIGMSSNVVSNIDSDTLSYGNPCKFVKPLIDGRY